MPAHPFYTNFTAGTVTEKLDARVDFAKYQNSARVVRNGIVLPQGGVASRGGTIFLGRAKHADKRCRLVPFQFSVDQSYMCEFGEGYVRFWTNRGRVEVGGVPVEVTTPYTEADLRELRFEQSADVMYIGHPDYPPAKISRVTLTQFQYNVINFLPTPSYEPRVAPPAALTLSVINPGLGTATTSAPTFLAGDVGRQIWSGVGRAVITNFVSSTNVGVRVLDPFTSASMPSGQWTMDGSPNAGTLTPSADTARWSFVVLTSSLDAFRSTDVGKYIYVHDGVLQITTINSATSASAQILRRIGATTAAAAGSWTLESAAWSDDLGYPGVPMLFQQRLWWAGSPSFQDFVWGSRSNDYEAHGRGELDNDAVVYQLATPGVNLVRWMKPSSVKGFALGTVAGEITLDGGSEQPLTPSNVQMTERTRYGADFTVDAMKVDNQIIFIQRGGTRVRELAYKFAEDAFASPDISILAEHLFRTNIVEMAYVSTPESLIAALRHDGIINFNTYERAQEVVAWSYAETADEDIFESVAAIPNACGDGDELWTATKRKYATGGYWGGDFWGEDFWAEDMWAEGAEGEARYIEVFDGQMNTDAGLVRVEGDPTNTLSGLDHLEGRVVRVVIEDGTEYNLLVSGGIVTLPDGVSTVGAEVGLAWVMTVVTVRPELQIPNGTIQGRRQKWGAITVRVYCTRGEILLNGEVMDYPGEEERGPETVLDSFSGNMKQKLNVGWGRDGFITIQRPQAKPCTITGITGSLQVADD